MIIQIPDKILEKLSVTPEQVKLEVALVLYAKGILTLEQASKIAELDQLRFQQALGARSIPMHYGKEDFEEDLKTLSEIGRL